MKASERRTKTPRRFRAALLLTLTSAVAALGVHACVSNAANAQQQDGRRGGRDSKDTPDRGGLLAQMSTFRTDVPAHPFDIVLVRPSPTSITASVVAYADTEGYIEYGTSPGNYPHKTPQQKLAKGEPALFLLDELKPGTSYTYRWRSPNAAATQPASKPPASKPDFAPSEEYTFRTPPTPGDTSQFVFTIQADSHLDPNMTPEVYAQTLANALADTPAFHIDLGDTFMTDKRGRNFKDSLPQYVAQRYYFGQLCHSAALFMVLGNHDGEVGYANDSSESMGPWSYRQRTRFFPEPLAAVSGDSKAMYSGRTSFAKGQGSNYYDFTWGDAQFIVLDPFWFTTARPRGGGGGGPGRDKKDADTAPTDENWARTLGKDQYDWLTRTLERSNARYKFVFIHHMVGGLGKANRGGMEASVFFEWGGKNADGSHGFAERRPGWAMPIHDLLVKHHVAAVFHGHDHLYVRNERDGVIYQCVPQPGNVAGGTRSAAEYGYTSGTILGSPGYLRVRVGADKSTVEFVRSAVADAGGAPRGARKDSAVNGSVVHQYSIAPAALK